MLLTELETYIKEIIGVNLDAEFDVIILDSESGETLYNELFAVDVCYDYDKVLIRVNLETCPACRQRRDYIKSIGYINDNEKNELNQWVADGNSVYDNPFDIYDDVGNPIDFINGYRLIIEMCNTYTNSFEQNFDSLSRYDPDELPF
jgi:hypothetical protein